MLANELGFCETEAKYALKEPDLKGMSLGDSKLRCPDADGMDFEDGCMKELGDVPENSKIVVIELPDIEIVDGRLLDEVHHDLDNAQLKLSDLLQICWY